MNYKKIKKSIAILLSLVLTVSCGQALSAEPLQDAGSVSAQEIMTSEVSSQEIAVSSDTAQSEISENETVSQNEYTGEEVTDEALTEEVSDSGLSETVQEEAAEVSENVAEISVEEASGAQILFANGSLDSQLLSTRLSSFEQDIYSDFIELKDDEAGVTYDAERAFFETDSEEDARRVSEMYGAEFVSYDMGVGVMKYDSDVMSLKDSVMCSLYDEDVNVRIYPDHIQHIYEEGSSCIYKTNDPYYDTQWYHETISDEKAWGISTGKGVKVAVIDTGISQDHEDLKDNIDSAYVYGYSTAEDENGHGSHCAGIIASVSDNNAGGCGIAPDARIVSLRAASAEGALYESHVVSAINKAVSEKVNVISMSFGSYSASEAQKNALEEATNKGIFLVAAAGNDHTSSKSYPAAFDNVLAVASYDKSAKLSYFSNYGDWVDIVSPGSDIYSTYKDGGYKVDSGTSMATPAVAGIVALMYGSDGYYTDSENANSTTVQMIKKCLLESRNNTTYTSTYGSVAGGVEAYDAVAAAKKEAVGETADEAVTVEVPAKPVISTVTDAKSGAVTVTLSNIAEGTSCYYTTDGSVPTMISANEYNANKKIVLSEEGTYNFKAIAVNKAAISTGYKYASSDIASKSIKVAIPKSADYEASEIYVSADVNNKIYVIAGKSVRISGTVSPNNSSKKKVTFTMDKQNGDAADGVITVNKSGTIKVSKDAQAGDKAHIKLGIDGCDLPAANCEEVEVVVKTSGVSAVVSSYGNTRQEIYTVSGPKGMPTTLDVAGSLTPSAGDNLTYKYTSSNKKVALVDKNGMVKAAGNGSCNITALAMDGSGKKAVVKVKCITPVSGMYLVSSTGQTGSSKLAAGKSITLKPVFTGSGKNAPTNKKVTWSSSSSYVTVNKNGKATATKNAPDGESAVITCISEDTGEKATYTFTVKGSVKYMGILKKSVDKYKRVRYSRYLYKLVYQYTLNTYASSATAGKTFSAGSIIDVSDLSSYYLAGKDLVYASANKYSTAEDSVTKTMGTDEYIVTVKANRNLLVNSVDESGSVEKICVAKKGTYSVVYKAVDGSGKKFTLKIKVK